MIRINCITFGLLNGRFRWFSQDKGSIWLFSHAYSLEQLGEGWPWHKCDGGVKGAVSLPITTPVVGWGLSSIFPRPSQPCLLLFRMGQSCLRQLCGLGPAQEKWSRRAEGPEVQILLQLLSRTPTEQVDVEGRLVSSTQRCVWTGSLTEACHAALKHGALRREARVHAHGPQRVCRSGHALRIHWELRVN